MIPRGVSEAACGFQEVPPLRYDWVTRLCKRFPQLKFELNGGLKTLGEVRTTMGEDGSGSGLTGWMIGRAAYNSSWQTLGTADTEIFCAESDVASSRRQVIADYLDYAEEFWKAQGGAKVGVQVQLELQGVLCQPLLGLISKGEDARWRESLEGGVDALLARGSGSGGFELRQLVEGPVAALPPPLLDAPPTAPPASKLLSEEDELVH